MKRIVTCIAVAVCLMSGLSWAQEITPTWSIDIHRSICDDLCLSPNAKFLAAWENDSIKLLDAKTGKTIRSFKQKDNHSVAFNHDGTRIMSGGADRQSKVWDLTTGKRIKTHRGHKWPIKTVAFSADGKYAASGSMDRTVRVWKPSANRILYKLSLPGMVTDLDFSPDGSKLLADTDKKSMSVYQSSNGKKLLTIKCKKDVKRPAWSRSSKYIIAGSGRNVDVYDAVTGKLLSSFSGSRFWINTATFNKDETVVIGAGHDTKIYLWDWVSGTLLTRLSAHKSEINSLVFDPVSGSLWSMDRAENIKKWDIEGIDPNFRRQFKKAVKVAVSTQEKFKVYDDYQGRLLFPDDKAMLETLYLAAMQQSLDDSLTQRSPEQQIAAYARFIGRANTSERLDRLGKFARTALTHNLKNDRLDTPTRLQWLKKWSAQLTASHAGLNRDMVGQFFKIDIRHTFKEGKIGQRYVPATSHQTSSTKTRYINGTAINETTYDSYTRGGYDESRYGYTNVYQIFNESDGIYLVEVEISATVSSSNYKTGKSWGGDEYKKLKTNQSKLVERSQFLLKPGAQVKDQLVVGEKMPEDFALKVINLTRLDKAWVDGLEIALTGKSLAKTRAYMQDKRAYNWLPELGSAFAKTAAMNLDYDITTGKRFDKDFVSDVTLTISNNNPQAIKLTLVSEFISDGQPHRIVMAPNSKSTSVFQSKGTDKDKLDIRISVIEPVN